VSAAYNFTLPGEGLYTVEAKNKFHYLNTTSNTSVPIFADSIALRAILTGQLAAGRIHALASPQKREQYKSCSADQQQLIAQAAVQAKAYSEAALQYLTSTKTSTERYKTWFGKFTAKRHQKVIAQFTKLANNDFSAMTFDCSCDEADTCTFLCRIKTPPPF
jgi:peptidyl-Lys metalloendopeptidase